MQYKDLSGVTIGNLFCIKKLQSDDYSRKELWLVKCLLCNRQDSLTKAYIRRNAREGTGCSVCRRGQCVVCGQDNISPAFNKFCSADCYRIHQNKTGAIRAKKYHANNPSIFKQYHARRKKKIDADPALKERLLEKERARNQARRNDPVKGPIIREQDKKRYEENREFRRRQHQQWYSNLTIEEKRSLNEGRVYDKPSINKRRRELRNQQKQRDELAKLFSVGEQLTKLDEDDSDEKK